MMSWILRAHLALATVWLVAAVVRAAGDDERAPATVRALCAAASATLAWQLTAGAGHGTTTALVGAALVHLGAAGLALGSAARLRQAGAALVSLGLIGLAARLAVPF